MSLNADLVRRADRLTETLSDTVELLLEAFLQEEEARQADIQANWRSERQPQSRWSSATDPTAAKHNLF